MLSLPVCRAVTVLGLCAGAPVFAQATAPSLEDVLTQLEASYQSYVHRIPNLSAQEDVLSTVSSRAQKFAVRQVSTRSTFRVVREPASDDPDHLSESHVLELVNNVKPTPETMAMVPAIATGIFSYAPLLASKQMWPCYEYKLKQHAKGGKLRSLTVEFKQKPIDPATAAVCPRPEYAYGTVTLEPQSLHILTIEKTVPAMKQANNTWGRWTWKVEYAPVRLGEAEYWLPKRILSQSSTLADARFVPPSLSRGLDSIPLDAGRRSGSSMRGIGISSCIRPRAGCCREARPRKNSAVA